jgi:hypothetical protein
MEEHERTRDIYEQIAAYPKPPLIALPEPDNLDSLEQLGLQPSGVARWVVKAAMGATGFRAFHKQLPGMLEDLLRRTDLRGTYLFAPVVAASLALEDDPRNLSPIERAATLLFAAHSLYRDMASGNLAPDRDREQILEMGQYPNLFSTSLVVDGNGARLFKSDIRSQITVVVAKRLYLLQIGNLGAETTIEQLQAALTELVEMAQRPRPEADQPSAGILTTANHATQCQIFGKLQQIDVNRASLSAIRHSLLTLCLDLDVQPSSYADATLIAQSGNCENRWYHSSLQLVVFGNAKASAICNFSAYLDGNTMMRGASEIQQRAAACPVADPAGRNLARLPSATELGWEIDESFVQQARQELQMVQDRQQATFEIQGIGRALFTAHNIDAVPAFIVALQMTAKRLTGDMLRITQFLNMSRYRCMDLVTANVTTPEVMCFVDYLDGPDAQDDRAKDLLHEAIESQVRECRKARRYLDLDDIFSLFIRTRDGFRRRYVVVVVGLALMLLRVLGLFKPAQREVLVSHPELYPNIPVIGRPGIRLPYLKRFGLHYQLWEDRIVVTMMPSVSWAIPNAKFMDELHESLIQLRSLIASEDVSPDADDLVRTGESASSHAAPNA